MHYTFSRFMTCDPFFFCLLINGFSLASSLTGVTKLWEMPQVTNKIAILKDHKERATDVVFSPVDDCLATASADRTAKLWKTDGTLLLKVIWIVLLVLPSTHQGSTSGQQALTKHGDCGI